MSDFRPKLPEVKFNKNGYEIRTEILKQAQDLIGQEFSWKWSGWEMSTAREPVTGKLLTTVDIPVFPGIDKVLETAERMYAFVNQNTTKK